MRTSPLPDVDLVNFGLQCFISLRREGELMRSGTFLKFSGGPGPPGAAALHSHRDIALCNFVDIY